MYEYVAINLIIWMAKRNVTNKVFAKKVKLKRNRIVDIKRGQFHDLSETLLDKFARELKIDKRQLIEAPEPVEIAYLPGILNAYIVGIAKGVSRIAQCVGFSEALIQQIRLKHRDRKSLEIIEAKQAVIRTLTPEQINALGTEMGINFLDKDPSISNHNTSPSNEDSSSDSRTFSDDTTSHDNYPQKRLRANPRNASVDAPTTRPHPQKRHRTLDLGSQAPSSSFTSLASPHAEMVQLRAALSALEKQYSELSGRVGALEKQYFSPLPSLADRYPLVYQSEFMSRQLSAHGQHDIQDASSELSHSSRSDAYPTRLVIERDQHTHVGDQLSMARSNPGRFPQAQTSLFGIAPGMPTFFPLPSGAALSGLSRPSRMERTHERISPTRGSDSSPLSLALRTAAVSRPPR